MNLIRNLFAAALVLACTAIAAAQEIKCNLKVEQAPAIHGFRLGMSHDQVLSQLAQLGVRPGVSPGDEFGYSSLYFSPFIEASRQVVPGYESVENVWLSFLDRQLTSISIRYKSVPWNSAVEFLSRVSAGLGLPNSWRTNDNQSYKQLCEGFVISATYDSNSQSVGLSATGVQQVIDKRIEEKKGKQRQAFKP